jgi:hypothetical protein
VYSDPQVAGFINDQFVPVRIHVREQADEYKRLGQRFNAQWTPTVLIVDASGAERYRTEGFLPVEDFLSQLTVGLGHAAFAAGDFAAAERYFRDTLAKYANSEAAPEAQYWAGVARYKASGDAAALGATAKAFDERYQSSSWAKKASVWKS